MISALYIFTTDELRALYERCRKVAFDRYGEVACERAAASCKALADEVLHREAKQQEVRRGEG